MDIKALKTMKETLMSCVQSQMVHLETVDTKELGEVIDMIKDIEETIYYYTITEAMKESNHQKEWIEDKHHRDSKSSISRIKYMEAKEMKYDKNTQLQELEKYIKELTSDIIEMVEDSSPEEKKYLANKMSSLAQRLVKEETHN